MPNCELYYNIVKKYRAELTRINGRFDAEIERKKPYAGSAGHAADLQKIEHERMAEIAELRADCRESFDACIKSMQRHVESRPLTPPTSEMLNTIQLLRMKKTVSRDELERAANGMQDCPPCPVRPGGDRP